MAAALVQRLKFSVPLNRQDGLLAKDAKGREDGLTRMTATETFTDVGAFS